MDDKKIQILHTLFSCFYDIIKCVIIFMESHPITIGVITAVLSAFWVKRHIRQKRLDACSSYYANLALMLQALYDRLINMNLLMPDGLNVFCLHYTDKCRADMFGNSFISEEQHMELSEITKRLYELLLNAENNINPKSIPPEDWYSYQWYIFDLCALILGYQNLRIADATSKKPKELCEITSNAIKKTIISIRKEQNNNTRFKNPFRTQTNSSND